jgi:hypothetical protein
MGIDPEKVNYLRVAAEKIGPIRERSITQRGEVIESLKTQFMLLRKIPAQNMLRNS